MSSAGLKNIVESLIFASADTVSLKEIKDVFDNFKIDVTMKEIEESVSELNTEYEKNGNAFQILKVAGGFQFATRKKYAHFVGKISADVHRKKLSQQAIETLAIIAYKQPITRTEIEFIRGVNVDYIVNSLLERDLITIKGRADGPGRPIIYGTTANFLKVLGINSLEDLPKLREINEILKSEKIEGITEADIDLFNTMSIAAKNEVTSEQGDTGELPIEFPNGNKDSEKKEQSSGTEPPPDSVPELSGEDEEEYDGDNESDEQEDEESDGDYGNDKSPEPEEGTGDSHEEGGPDNDGQINKRRDEPS